MIKIFWVLILCLFPVCVVGQSWNVDYDLQNIRSISEMENDLPNESKENFRNHVYVEVWGHSWYSLNYVRLLPSTNILFGGGMGGAPTRRTSLGGGEVVHLFIEKQFQLKDKFYYGFGLGSTYDFGGTYENILDPFYFKLVMNRYSVSLKNDRLYYGLSLYYSKWDDWSLRPSAKLGISF